MLSPKESLYPPTPPHPPLPSSAPYQGALRTPPLTLIKDLTAWLLAAQMGPVPHAPHPATTAGEIWAKEAWAGETQPAPHP